MADPLLNPKQAAAYLGYTAHTLQYWRCHGGGPPYVKMNPGGHPLTPHSVRYWQSDLDAWVASFGKRKNTSQQKADPVPLKRPVERRFIDDSLRLKPGAARFIDDIPFVVIKPPPD